MQLNKMDNNTMGQIEGGGFGLALRMAGAAIKRNWRKLFREAKEEVVENVVGPAVGGAAAAETKILLDD